MRVVITGAAGLIGGIVSAELAKDHDLILVDRVRTDAPGALRKDLRRYLDDRPRLKRLMPWRSWWEKAFAGADAVVHLAANGNPLAPWKVVGGPNIQTTWNVFDAAARFGVSRVVFASSTWAVKGHERALGPACYSAGGPKVGADAPPRPVGAYGLAKAMGEMAGAAMVDENRVKTFIAVRIGWCAPPGQAPSDARDETIWVGHRDLARLVRCCVEVPILGTHVLYGISGQRESPYELTQTRATVAWSPQDAPPPFARA